jgi:hypothetical protein
MDGSDRRAGKNADAAGSTESHMADTPSSRKASGSRKKTARNAVRSRIGCVLLGYGVSELAHGTTDRHSIDAVAGYIGYKFMDGLLWNHVAGNGSFGSRISNPACPAGGKNPMKLLGELKNIPGLALLIALLLIVSVPLLILILPSCGAFEMLFITCIFLIALVLIVGYIYRDAQRRGMRHVMWTLLSIFMPYGTGIILYFLLRDPKMIPCPKCGTPARGTHVFCTQCGADLSPFCPACKRAVELDWNRCAHCGTDLSAQPAVGSQQ